MKKIIFTSLILSSYVFGATLSDIQENALIIYNSNIGLIHEKRDLQLNPNDRVITYKNIASSINTDSVHLTIDPSVTLFSQQYRYDKLTQAKLLQAYIGKQVEFRQLKNRDEFQIITATLLSYNATHSILRNLDYKIITVKNENILFDEIPKELITKPSLVWNINATKNLDTSIELDYLINNISFQSNYILNLEKDSCSLDGWITINNHSGKTFKNTKLSLLAGDINRIRDTKNRAYKVQTLSVMADTTQVTHKAFEGYHFYAIPFHVDLANNEKTQIKFFSQDAIPIQRKYEANLNNPLYLMGERKSDVSQFISLSALHQALPKGVLRTYAKLDDQTVLLGETNIEHTSKNTALKLKIGKNFDIQVKQTLLQRQDTKKRFDVDVKYTIENHSDKDKLVTLLIPFNKNGDSQVQTKQNYTFTKGNLVTFTLQIKANETKEFQVNFKSKR